jgi:hypothetical protein
MLVSIQHIRRCVPVGEITEVYTQQHLVRCQHAAGDPAALAGDMTIEALPTWFGGTTFRSKLEADWAATLDSLNIRWQYEPQTITLPSGTTYIPDFWLPDIGTWLEAKGTGVPRIEKAIELGQTLACHCEDQCACDWPGGQLVLVGHPAKPYDAYADPTNRYASHRVLRNRNRRHHGHPNWSTTTGRTAWLTRCLDCNRGGWFTSPQCRACRGPLAGTHGYSSGDAELEFVNASCRSAIEHEAAS